MAGIYIHIPFCKSRCTYCDFFSTTLMEKRDDYIRALTHEVVSRRNYLPSQEVRTIYFGGGTPSTLSLEQFGTVLEAVRANYCICPDAEITLEANPSDITDEKLRGWREQGVNRLSMGIQSLQDPLLKLIGRRHNAAQALEAVRLAQKAGMNNISIDLMYGLPTQTMQQWQDDIGQAMQLGIQHISAYCLSYEEGTVLTARLHNQEISAIDDETENAMYDYLVHTLENNGFMRYEVSNFALSGYESRHNSSYWNATPYLGLGAGAHSFDGNSRQWNIDDLQTYIDAQLADKTCFEREVLTADDRYNELVMLGLRTRNGLNLSEVPSFMQEHCKLVANSYICAGLLKEILDGNGDTRLVATQQGIHILNRIIEDLMI